MQRFGRLKKILIQHNLHYLLLLFFFCLNGYRIFRDLVAVDSLVVFFISVALTFLFLSFLLKKFGWDQIRIGMILLYFMFLFLFFGNIEDGFSGLKALVFLSEPLYFIPFIFLVSVLVVMVIRKVNSFFLFRSFVNTVLLIWVLSEIFFITFKKKDKEFFRVEDMRVKSLVHHKKLPVYLVVLDEYGGDSTLLKGFNFDNTHFKSDMIQLGFKDVHHSTANYPLTVHSVSSTLDMDYLPDDILTSGYAYGYKYGLTRIRENKTAAIFSKWGYRINNFSFFDFKQAPADFTNIIWGGGARVVTARCMHARLYKHLISFSHRYHFGFWENRERDHNFNQIHFSLTHSLEEAGKDTIPSFNFIHILSPHKPFLFDSSGNKLDYSKIEKGISFSEPAAYLWSVKKINQLITDWSAKIIKAYQGDVIILIMSDHGPSIRKGEKRKLDNLNLVYVPDGKNSGWYEGMSNVNQFRVLFNTFFGQQFPILKDRMIPEVPGDQLAD